MTDHADAVVIGSGALGASVAYHLTKLGQRVALVDKHDLVSQTSPRAAGLTAQARATDAMTSLAMRSVKLIEGFAADTGEPFVYHQSGSLRLARLDEHAEQLADFVDRGRRLGLSIDFVSPSEAKRLNPFLHTKGVKAMTFTPSDLYLEPAHLPQGYVRAAGKRGAALKPNTTVTGITKSQGGISGVETDQGLIKTATVVDTAGAWTRLVGDMAGVQVALTPTRHQLLITEPIDGVDINQPITRVVDCNVYVRPEQGGLMLGGYESNPRLFAHGKLSTNFRIEQLELDANVLWGLADQIADQLPVFQSRPPIRQLRGGLPTMTADGCPIVGPLVGLNGFWVASGCCVGGLSISPALGEALAAWIVDGKPPVDMSLMRPDRFAGAFATESDLVDACRWRYANHYATR